MKHKMTIGLILILLFPVLANAYLVVNHSASTQFDQIPQQWIDTAKANLKIAYGHTSHGSQLITGMNMLRTEKGSTYAWNSGGADGALDLTDYLGNFGNLGLAHDLNQGINFNYNITAWANATRLYLRQHPETNVIIWSWCYGMMTSEQNINVYLHLMRDLELEFPNVKFVYMTGHVVEGQRLCDYESSTDGSCQHNLRATQIRNFVKANNGILYDFADIESYDPDGNYFGDKLVGCDCVYDSNGDGVIDSNWAIEYCSRHSCLSCGECAHSYCINCYQKGKAAWYLWARLAGWDGGTGLPSCTDADGDGYGAAGSTSCSHAGTDCNDNNATIHPGGTETCGNGIDEDCTGADLECSVPGDLDDDGVVDGDDFFIIVSDFGKTSGFNNPRSDTNGDNIIDIYDIVYVASRMA